MENQRGSRNDEVKLAFDELVRIDQRTDSNQKDAKRTGTPRPRPRRARLISLLIGRTLLISISCHLIIVIMIVIVIVIVIVLPLLPLLLFGIYSMDGLFYSQFYYFQFKYSNLECSSTVPVHLLAVKMSVFHQISNTNSIKTIIHPQKMHHSIIIKFLFTQ